MGLRLCLVGATGAVGTEFLNVLERYELPFTSIDLLASSRSAGKTLRLNGKQYSVIDTDTYDFSKTDIAFFSAGSGVSKLHAGRASAAGCTVIDNTSFFRMDSDKKLIIPQVNGYLLEHVKRGEIIANPNCSTIQIVKALHPINKLFGLQSVVASTYQAASGAGVKAVQELIEHSNKDQLSKTDSNCFAAPLAMNVVPVIDELYDSGWTKEELKITQESRKIMAMPSLAITATAVRVPVIRGHSVAIYVRTQRPVFLPDLQQAFNENNEVQLLTEQIPTPRFIDDPRQTYVGRLRLNPDDPCGLWLWVVADNLWVGAAYNGFQIAAHIIKAKF